MKNNKPIRGHGVKKWENLRRTIYQNYNEEKPPDITEHWIAFLKRDKRLKKNSFVFANYGGRGAGKTADEFKIINITLKNNPKRVVQFWQSSQDLINNIQKVCPEEFKFKFEIIYKLRDIKQNSIFVIDEGLLGANAKEALRIEMKNLIKFFSKSRHKNIIAIVNSITYGILSELKNVADMVMYKRLPRSMIRNMQSKDANLRIFANTILKLKDWEGLLISNYKRFNREGLVSWKYEDYCPWFNDDISMYQKSSSSDVDFDEIDRLKNQHIKLVDWIINTVSDEFTGKNSYRNFSMWLYTNHTDIYQDNLKQLRIIHNLYLYTLTNSPNKSIKTAVLNATGWKLTDFSFKYNEEEILNLIKRNKKSRISNQEITVYKELKKGVIQTDLALKYNTTQKTISERNSKVRGAFNDKIGILFEEEYAKYLDSLKIYDKVDLIGTSGQPDILCYKENTNEVHIYSCKTTEKRPHTIRKKYLIQEHETTLKLESNYSKVRLFLPVLIYSENKTYQKELDYRNPTDITIK